MTTVRMTKIQEGLAKQAMLGDKGEVLLDLITDQIVLADDMPDSHKAGAGIVLKFLRSLYNDSDHLIPAPKKPTE
jgi:hypothetical protein